LASFRPHASCVRQERNQERIRRRGGDRTSAKQRWGGDTGGKNGRESVANRREGVAGAKCDKHGRERVTKWAGTCVKMGGNV